MIKQENFKNLAKDWIKKLDNMIDKLENNNPKWIDICEETPEVGEVVIVCIGNEIFTDVFRGNLDDEWEEVDDEWATAKSGAVEYWMRIPDIPEPLKKKNKIKEEIKQWFKIESFRNWYENYCDAEENEEISYPEFLLIVQEKINEFKQNENWRLENE